MMNDLYSTRVQAPAYYSDPRNGSSELADLKPITGGFVEDGPLVRKTPNNYENSKKRRVLVGPRNNIWVGTLNVRTLRRSKVELANRIIANSIDIMGIQEHRIVHTEEARIEDLHGGVRLITCSAWRNSGGASVGGVGLMITKRAYESISSITPYGSRIIKVSFSGNPRLTVIVVYSPTEASTPEEAEDFYNNLRDLISSTPPHDLLLVLGDFNAKLGPEIPGFTYNSRTNRNGSLFLDTLEECDLEATNLRFMRKKEKRWTFLSEGTHHKALLDYVLVRKKWRASIKDTRTTNSFNSIGSDHRAVIISVQNRFESLANMDGSASEKYQTYTDAVHQSCKEHLKPRPKRKNLDVAKDPRVEAARASVVAAKEQFYLDQNDDTRESLNQAKNKLGLAYTSVEEEVIERQVKRVEETADLVESSRYLLVETSGNPRLTVIVVYSPTEASTPEEAEDFYNNLRDLISSTPPHDLLLVLGDFNAKLGPEIPGFTYNSRTNRNGSLFLDTLEECDLEATNLRFMRKKEKRWTFLSEGTHHKALLDYMLVRKKWRASIKDTRTTNSFNSIGSDHRAVISKIRLSLRKKQQPAKKVLYDYEPLVEDKELRDTFAVSVQNRLLRDRLYLPSASEKYQTYTDAVHQSCKEHLKPRPKRKNLDVAKDPRVEAARASVELLLLRQRSSFILIRTMTLGRV
eukprot:sb/3462654/